MLCDILTFEDVKWYMVSQQKASNDFWIDCVISGEPISTNAHSMIASKWSLTKCAQLAYEQRIAWAHHEEQQNIYSSWEEKNEEPFYAAAADARDLEASKKSIRSHWTTMQQG